MQHAIVLHDFDGEKWAEKNNQHPQKFLTIRAGMQGLLLRHKKDGDGSWAFFQIGYNNTYETPPRGWVPRSYLAIEYVAPPCPPPPMPQQVSTIQQTATHRGHNHITITTAAPHIDDSPGAVASAASAASVAASASQPPPSPSELNGPLLEIERSVSALKASCGDTAAQVTEMMNALRALGTRINEIEQKVEAGAERVVPKAPPQSILPALEQRIANLERVAPKAPPLAMAKQQAVLQPAPSRGTVGAWCQRMVGLQHP